MNYKITKKTYFLAESEESFGTMQPKEFKDFEDIDGFLHSCISDVYIYDIPEDMIENDLDPVLIASRFCDVVHFESYIAGAI